MDDTNPLGCRPKASSAQSTANSASDSYPLPFGRQEKFWEGLLNSIAAGDVVPVVGLRLFTWGEETGAPKTMLREMAEWLLRRHNINPASVPLGPHRELFQAVSHLKEKITAKAWSHIYNDVCEAYDEVTAAPDFQTPKAITQLAAISEFRLIVTTAPYPILAQALTDKHRTTTEIVHTLGSVAPEARGLPVQWQSVPDMTYLFYLFGKLDDSTGFYVHDAEFAIHDEDILEYAHNLLCGRDKAASLFIQALRKKHLLFIGCNFPDWLSRFFLRLTADDRLSSNTLKYSAWLVEEMHEQPDLTVFLENFSGQTTILSTLSPQDFVGQLYSRWERRRLKAVASLNQTQQQSKIVFFISYLREDREAADKIYEFLKGEGLTEAELWYDQQNIEPGDNFDDCISRAIDACCCFLALLSDSITKFEETYLLREHVRIANRLPGRMPDAPPLVIPIIVDKHYDPAIFSGKLPSGWSKYDFGHAPGGMPEDRLVNALRKRINQAKNPSSSPR